MIFLVASYIEKNTKRAFEYVECLEKNISNSCFQRVGILIEEDSQHYWNSLKGPAAPHTIRLVTCLEDPKVDIIHVARRATYKDFFTVALHKYPKEIIVMANADIWLDQTVSLLNDVWYDNLLIALSRTDPMGSADISQDVWSFKTPIKNFPCDWWLGRPGCENRLVNEAVKAGIRVANPCLSVKAHHVHASQVRNYSDKDRIYGGMTSAPPCSVESIKKANSP